MENKEQKIDEKLILEQKEHQKKVDYALRFLHEKIKDIKCTIAEAFETVECFNFISSEIKKNEKK